jgi:putative ABC transport system permease protein
MLGNTLHMALREVRRNTLRSGLTTLGIVIGVAAVIALVTLGEGASRKVKNDITSMGVNMLTLYPGVMRRGPTSSAAEPLSLADAIAIESEVSEISGVAPAASRNLLAVFGNKNWNTSVQGVTNAYVEVRNLEIQTGRTFSDAELAGGTPVCVLGATVQRELFGREDALGSAVRLGRLSCTVVGVTRSKGSSTFGNDQDDFVLLPLAVFQRRIAGNNDITTIYVSAAPGRSTALVQSQIEALVRERRRVTNPAEDDFTVRDMAEIAATMASTTGALAALLGAIAGVSLLVGGIGIMNIMLVSVTERTREIGLRMAIGARGRDVLLQFLVEAVVLSLFGGSIGIALGLGMSKGVTAWMTWPTKVSAESVAVAFVFAAVTGVFFGFYPARKAAALDPIDALRFE